ncbi:MAG: hypothetical protein KBH93_08285 [Anaerolineae bacterium]|nr:hypothetical protein [Anaerolineae bacterium]
MKHTFLKAANWLACDPRHAMTVALVVLTVLAVTLALVPGTPALALEITSGS